MSDIAVISTFAEWSAAVRARDGHKCMRCGSTEKLHAHHIQRKSAFPELALELSNGETLCNLCHAKEHKQDFPALSVILASDDHSARSNGPKKPRKAPTEVAPQYGDDEIMDLPQFRGMPNADDYLPKPELARALVMAIGRSQRWIAERIGISERRLRYVLAGSRVVDGKSTPITMTYVEQFALQCLAQAAEVLRIK